MIINSDIMTKCTHRDDSFKNFYHTPGPLEADGQVFNAEYGRLLCFAWHIHNV